MTETTDDKLRKVLEAMMPKNIDDVFRKNRDKGRLYAATHAELEALRGPVPIAPTKGTIRNFWFLSIQIGGMTPSDSETLIKTYLLGYNSTMRTGWITSYIEAIDGLAVYTRSGSVYMLEGEPVGEDRYDLPFLCAALRGWGFGQVFGIPEFFF